MRRDRLRTAVSGGREPRFVALALITGVGPIATDAFIPAFPQIAREMATTPGVVSMSLTLCIVGMAVGQIVCGPISDILGRRPVLLVGSVLFMFASTASAVAMEPASFIASRLVVGLAAGACVTSGRALVGDRYSGAEASRRFGTLAAVNFVAPVIAPALGGIILEIADWRAILWTVAALGLVMTVSVVLALPETLPSRQRPAGELIRAGALMADLITDRSFMRHVIISALATSSLLVYVGGSAFTLETVYEATPQLYALVFGTNASATIVGGVAFRVLVTRSGSLFLRAFGLAISSSALVALLLTTIAHGQHVVPIGITWILLAIVALGVGLIVPASTVLAQTAGRRAGGTAAALQGGGSFLIGALATPLVGWIGSASLLPMVALMAGFMVSAAVFTVVTTRLHGTRKKIHTT